MLPVVAVVVVVVVVVVVDCGTPQPADFGYYRMCVCVDYYVCLFGFTIVLFV